MERFGIPGLDEIVTGLRLGDNVVWQIDEIRDYRHFAARFVKAAIEQGRKVVYVRFADHAPVLDARAPVTLCRLDAHAGFESFSARLNGVITEQGREVYYVFDCLSDLLPAWSNDLMIGNFFKITCPYLFELDTIAYFALLRNSHSYKTIARIRDTTQLLLDVYRVRPQVLRPSAEGLEPLFPDDVPAARAGGRPVRPDRNQRRHGEAVLRRVHARARGAPNGTWTTGTACS